MTQGILYSYREEFAPREDFFLIKVCLTLILFITGMLALTDLLPYALKAPHPHLMKNAMPLKCLIELNHYFISAILHYHCKIYFLKILKKKYVLSNFLHIPKHF